MFKKDDYVVYKHRVCIIKDIKKINLIDNTYYIITPIDDNSLIIDIPIENKMGVLRNIIDAKDAKKLINQIPKISIIENINGKNLEIKYKELLNTGRHEDLIKIIKTTYLRNKNRIDNKKKKVKKTALILNLQKNTYIMNYQFP